MKRQDLTLNLSRTDSADVTDSAGQTYLSRSGQRCRKLPIPIYSRFSSVLSPVYDSTTSNQVINVIHYWNFFVFEWSFPVVMKPSRYSFLLHTNLVNVVIRANLSWLIEPWVSCVWGFTFPNCNCIICPVVAEIRSGWCWCRRLTSTVSSLTLSHARALLLSRWSFLGAKFGLRLAFCPLERSRVFRSPCLDLCVCVCVLVVGVHRCRTARQPTWLIFSCPSKVFFPEPNGRESNLPTRRTFS
jgi:hypothetical protein